MKTELLMLLLLSLTLTGCFIDRGHGYGDRGSDGGEHHEHHGQQGQSWDH